MTLMTEVFDAWAAERVQKQPLPVAPPYLQPNLYAPQQPHQQAQHHLPGPYPHTQPQLQSQPYQQVQARYHFPSPIHQPVVPHSPSYNSPVSPHAVPNNTYGYRPPEAVELPAELPATMFTAPTPVPIRSTSTDVSTSSIALLARDLWSADFTLEEEEIAV
jgi:hypothetical protein